MNKHSLEKELSLEKRKNNKLTKTNKIILERIKSAIARADYEMANI